MEAKERKREREKTQKSQLSIEENKVGRLTPHDFKTDCEATDIKTVWCWEKTGKSIKEKSKGNTMQ